MKTTKKISKPIEKKKVKSIVESKSVKATSMNTPVPSKIKQSKKNVKQSDSSTSGISVIEVLKQAEEMHMVPVQSDVHPQTIEEHKKFEPQNHGRQEVTMRGENEKVLEAKANRKGTKRIYRMRKS